METIKQTETSKQRFVWRKESVLEESKDFNDQKDETYETLLQQFSDRLPPQRSFLEVYQNSVTVGQEFALTCLFLARHRVVLWEDELLSHSSNKLSPAWIQQQVHRSQILALMALMTIAYFVNSSASPPPPQNPKAKVQQRLSDAILSALFLRIVASILQTLTASFSTDTVERLTVAGMVIHLFTCDYSYANAIHVTNNEHNNKLSTSKRPTFQGGTVSLNAAFFSTILLASRLSSNVQVYIFVSSAIILFAFFPAARHAISQHPKGSTIHSATTVMLALSTACLLQDKWECLYFAIVLGIICGVAPLWKLWLQRYKRKISGPWEVVSVNDMMLDCAGTSMVKN